MATTGIYHIFSLTWTYQASSPVTHSLLEFVSLDTVGTVFLKRIVGESKSLWLMADVSDVAGRRE